MKVYQLIPLMLSGAILLSSNTCKEKAQVEIPAEGRKVIDVYLENYQYLQWAEANVLDFLVNWQALMRVHREMRNQTAADNQTETSK